MDERQLLQRGAYPAALALSTNWSDHSEAINDPTPSIISDASPLRARSSAVSILIPSVHVEPGQGEEQAETCQSDSVASEEAEDVKGKGKKKHHIVEITHDKQDLQGCGKILLGETEDDLPIKHSSCLSLSTSYERYQRYVALLGGAMLTPEQLDRLESNTNILDVHTAASAKNREKTLQRAERALRSLDINPSTKLREKIGNLHVGQGLAPCGRYLLEPCSRLLAVVGAEEGDDVDVDKDLEGEF